MRTVGNAPSAEPQRTLGHLGYAYPLSDGVLPPFPANVMGVSAPSLTRRGRTADFNFGTFRSCFYTDRDRARTGDRTARCQFTICRSKTFPITLNGSRVWSVFAMPVSFGAHRTSRPLIPLYRFVNVNIRSPLKTSALDVIDM